MGPFLIRRNTGTRHAIMMITFLTLLLAITTSIHAETGQCTFHDYEGLKDNTENAPFCGHRYTGLDVTRLVSMSSVSEGLCNQCLEVSSSAGGPKAYLLIVDKRGATGLDISKTAFMQMFPNDNPMNVQTCQWQVVDVSKCQGICFGSTEECTVGVQNKLPSYLLPAISKSNAGASPPVVNAAPSTPSAPSTPNTSSAPATTNSQQPASNAPATTNSQQPASNAPTTTNSQQPASNAPTTTNSQQPAPNAPATTNNSLTNPPSSASEAIQPKSSKPSMKKSKKTVKKKSKNPSKKQSKKSKKSKKNSKRKSKRNSRKKPSKRN